MDEPRIARGDPRQVLEAMLARQLHTGMVERNDWWHSYWEGRRMVTVPEKAPTIVQKLADDLGGTINYVSPSLPDGSGFATMSFPLPKDHWIYAERFNVPPMPFRKGTGDPEREIWAEKVRAVAKYAVRASTMNGKETDFDPDAMVQNFVTGMLGYHTPDGLSSDEWANPPVMETGTRPFPSFPNLAPNPENFAVKQVTGNVPTSYGVTVGGDGWQSTVRDCIARLKSARAKESTNRNLSTLLAVVVKVQKDLETLVGENVSSEERV